MLERCLFFVVLLNVVSCADLLSPSSFFLRVTWQSVYLVLEVPLPAHCCKGACCYALRTLMCQLRAGLFVGCGALWCRISFELVCSLSLVVVLYQLRAGLFVGWGCSLVASCCKGAWWKLVAGCFSFELVVVGWFLEGEWLRMRKLRFVGVFEVGMVGGWVASSSKQNE